MFNFYYVYIDNVCCVKHRLVTNSCKWFKWILLQHFITFLLMSGSVRVPSRMLLSVFYTSAYNISKIFMSPFYTLKGPRQILQC